MNDKTVKNSEPDMLPEYDFSGGVRGKHAQAYGNEVLVTIHKTDGTTEERTYNMPEGAIILDPDLRPYFPNAKAVNHALRVLVELIPNAPAADKAVN
jgi:hypothetical protein